MPQPITRECVKGMSVGAVDGIESMPPHRSCACSGPSSVGESELDAARLKRRPIEIVGHGEGLRHTRHPQFHRMTSPILGFHRVAPAAHGNTRGPATVEIVETRAQHLGLRVSDAFHPRVTTSSEPVPTNMRPRTRPRPSRWRERDVARHRSNRWRAGRRTQPRVAPPRRSNRPGGTRLSRIDVETDSSGAHDQRLIG
jgi:hypothetical protein